MGTIIYIIGLAISGLCLALILIPIWFFVTHHHEITSGDRKLTAKAIATDWDLWRKYVNIFGHDTKKLWETSPLDERIKLAEQALRPLDGAHDPTRPTEY